MFQKVKLNLASFLVIYLIVQNYYFSYNYLFDSKYQRENWRQAISYTDRLIDKNSIVVTDYHQPWSPMEWYSKKLNKYIGASTQMKVTNNSIKSSLLSHKKIIFYTYLSAISDPDNNLERFLYKNNYRLSTEKDFRGVGIIKIFKK
jgi:hypothetical protein